MISQRNKILAFISWLINFFMIKKKTMQMHKYLLSIENKFNHLIKK